MYGKIFDSIYDGTLVEDWRALVTFQQFIVLCDSDGVVDMTPSAISRRTGIPIEHIKAGIELLEKPDPWSRTPDEEGRRLLRLDNHREWGWQIVNHQKYKGLQDYDTVKQQNRDRQRRRRANQNEATDSNGLSRSVTDSHAQSRHTDKDTNTNTGNRRFTPPTVTEVRKYCQDRKNSVDPQRFVDFYEAKGWYVGKNKMKDWKAAVRTWEGDKKKDSADNSALAGAK